MSKRQSPTKNAKKLPKLVVDPSEKLVAEKKEVKDVKESESEVEEVCSNIKILVS